MKSRIQCISLSSVVSLPVTAGSDDSEDVRIVRAGRHNFGLERVFIRRPLGNVPEDRKGRTLRNVKVGALALMVGTMVAGPLTSGASAKVPVPPRPGQITGKPGHGCPYGAVCVYPRAKTFKTGPERRGIYYSYGPHNLHRQFGYHLVYNNQYNVNGVAAGFTFCFGYNGKGGEYAGAIMNHRGWWAPVDLTRVNSITLWLYNLRYYRFVNC